ncbi:molybdenum cofactor biosynthesis protein B [Pseudomonas sp. Marseille-Q1929]|uniref:molybdenum cofactor biosynthesis protein B n=1 Tax=Pseudomonas sp. Marseille-Q1929 TaxID=2730402 RepID=UPI001A8CED3B|nr:molybdenum cofactor biosynthesis protein B [Pseudomonas sp. Marseille-Q1929]MBO0497120.1 molybdenum cofactor biosynthesis protein B [Pseudomonas sp. Marseille-Q1929]
MAHLTQQNFVSLNIAVLTISDTRTYDTDTSGDTLVDRLQTAGHMLIDRGIVMDDIYQIRARVSQWIADPQVQVILMTGGTGFTARDNTPQAVLPLLDKQVDGFGELFRQVSLAEIGMSTLQSRALAGFSNGVLVCCMPGSPGACRTAWDQILVGQLDSRTGPCNFAPHLKPQLDQALNACESRS